MSDPRHVTPPVSEARLERQYAVIRARTQAGHGPHRRAWWVGAATVVAAAVAIATGSSWIRMHGGGRPLASSAGPEEGAVIEAPSSTDGTSISLSEGSRVVLAGGTRLRLTSARPSAIRLDIDRGGVEVDATHVEGRTFVVGAGPYAVHVVGTHFWVERTPAGRVAVRVDHGAVDVSSPTGETRSLTAGEQWSAPDPASAAPGPYADAPREQPSTATEAATPIAQAPSATVAGPPLGSSVSAKDLFDEAQRARAQGRLQDAARSLDRLRRTFRSDPRASIGAFELGRLRLDALGDPRGAEEALRDAMTLGPASPFREDAEARRVEALSRMGDASGCRSARDAYLARWPGGTYRRVVEAGCPDR